MSIIKMEDTDLVFKVWHERRLKDIIVPGSNQFNRYEDATVHALDHINLTIREGNGSPSSDTTARARALF